MDNIQSLQHTLCWTPAPPNLNVSARVLNKSVEGLISFLHWGLLPHASQATLTSLTLNFGILWGRGRSFYPPGHPLLTPLRDETWSPLFAPAGTFSSCWTWPSKSSKHTMGGMPTKIENCLQLQRAVFTALCLIQLFNSRLETGWYYWNPAENGHTQKKYHWIPMNPVFQLYTGGNYRTQQPSPTLIKQVLIGVPIHSPWSPETSWKGRSNLSKYHYFNDVKPHLSLSGDQQSSWRRAQTS